MAFFQFKAVNPEGCKLTGIREASSESELLKILKREKLTILSISQMKSRVLTPHHKARIGEDIPASRETFSLKKLFVRKRPNFEEITMATRQLSMILNAGIPITEAFRIVIASSDKNNPMRDVLTKIDTMLREGTNPEVAFNKFPGIFTSQYVSLITLGMSTGRLHETMGTLSSDLERDYALRKKVAAALAYPLFTFIFTLLINGIIFIYIFPRIIGVLTDLNVELPLISKIMIHMVNILTNPWYLALILILLVFFYYQFHYYIRTPLGKYHFDRLKLNIPVFGAVNRILFIERFSRTMSMLLKFGIALQEVLTITGKVCANDFLLDNLFGVLLREVAEGRDIQDILKEISYFPPSVTNLVAAGIASGDLVEPFQKISKFYEMELSNTLQKIVTLIEPCMVITMSVIIFFTILSLMLPVYQAIIHLGA